jgi:hypothetical protein
MRRQTVRLRPPPFEQEKIYSLVASDRTSIRRTSPDRSAMSVRVEWHAPFHPVKQQAGSASVVEKQVAGSEVVAPRTNRNGSTPLMGVVCYVARTVNGTASEPAFPRPVPL